MMLYISSQRPPTRIVRYCHTDDLLPPQQVIVASEDDEDDDDDPVDDPRDVDYVPDEMQAKKRPTEAEKLQHQKEKEYFSVFLE
jgi:hypothetical protein